MFQELGELWQHGTCLFVVFVSQPPEGDTGVLPGRKHTHILMSAL